MSFVQRIQDLKDGIASQPISKDEIVNLTDAQDDEDFAEVLDAERRRLSAELATFRPELIGGFKSPQRKARCSEICRRLVEIDLILADEE